MTTPPPPDVRNSLASLDAAVAHHIPPKTPENLLVATWNLRAFGSITPKWHAEADDSPKRDWYAVASIATVVSRFDVIALQEVGRNLAALRFLIAQLGSTWRFIVSDVTEGDRGNRERLTFIYDTDRVQPSGLVGEIVLPESAGDTSKQFARTPYAASFLRATTPFILTTTHVVWGASASTRLPEITSFAEWMRAWADRRGEWNDNLLVLGDFNLDRLGDPLFEAFVSTGLWPPTELENIPRTIFDNDNSRHFYDQIAWFSDEMGASLLHSMEYSKRAGTFDFIPHFSGALTRTDVSWRVSDHYPLWVEFAIPRGT